MWLTLLWLPLAAASNHSVRVHRRYLLQDPGVAIRGGLAEGYIASTVRIDGETFEVILDTGSPLLIVPCTGCRQCGQHHQFAPSTRGGAPFSIHYVEGSTLEGRFYNAVVELDEHRFSANVGCATRMTRLFQTQRADGILGLDERSVLRDLMQSDPSLPHTFALHLEEGNDRLYLGLDVPTMDASTALCPLRRHQENFLIDFLHVDVDNPAMRRFVHDRKLLIDSGTTYIYFEPSLFNAIKAILQAHGFRRTAYSEIGCLSLDAPAPTLTLVGAASTCRIQLRPQHYTVTLKNQQRCVVIFDTGYGNANTLGLVALDGRRSTFVLDAHRPSTPTSTLWVTTL